MDLHRTDPVKRQQLFSMLCSQRIIRPNPFRATPTESSFELGGAAKLPHKESRKEFKIQKALLSGRSPGIPAFQECPFPGKGKRAAGAVMLSEHAGRFDPGRVSECSYWRPASSLSPAA